MRTNIVHPGADELVYEIRGIVAVGETFAKMGVPIYWENIGDPIAKGRTMAPWMKDIIAETLRTNDASYGYSPTRGMLSARTFIAEMRNREGGVRITPDDILFFNGLGDAIATCYTYLNPHARVLGPNPAYSTHSSAEAAHSDSPHLTYRLDPRKNWLPNLEDIRNKVKYNPAIAGLLIINPDNPTGMVYPKAVLEEMVAIAREYGLFIIADEIYANLVYGGAKMTSLASILGEVPGIAMRGLSKEVPWPGSRCGWIEVYNQANDPMFARYAKTLLDAKMLQVCATTLPQTVLPALLGDPRYEENLATMRAEFEKKANMLYKTLGTVRGVYAPKPSGAFYASVVFEEGILNNRQTLPIENEAVRAYTEELVKNVPSDKRFVYYLMASTGICVVPLSGMNSTLEGFRLTLLEPDEKKFATMLETLKAATEKYTRSA